VNTANILGVNLVLGKQWERQTLLKISGLNCKSEDAMTYMVQELGLLVCCTWGIVGNIHGGIVNVANISGVNLGTQKMVGKVNPAQDPIISGLDCKSGDVTMYMVQELGLLVCHLRSNVKSVMINEPIDIEALEIVQ